MLYFAFAASKRHNYQRIRVLWRILSKSVASWRWTIWKLEKRNNRVNLTVREIAHLWKQLIGLGCNIARL